MNVTAPSLRLQRAGLIHDADAMCYARHGYVVVSGLIPQLQIDALMQLYRRDLQPSRYPFFRQNTNAYQPNELTAQGYVRQSFLDIHDYARYPEFSRSARDIFCSTALMQALERITGFQDFSLMQTMLFDLNAATPAHQDYYYLDSVPNGNLIAAWIALEDIDARAGRFYVLPGSQNDDFGATVPGTTHAQWLEDIRRHVAARSEEIEAPALRAGDVLFWNSRTVHGSLPTQDEAFSRKSLTAHFLPGGFDYGNLFSVKPNIQFKTYQGVRYYRNQPDFSQWNRMKFAIKTRAYNFPLLREALRSVRDRVATVRAR